jgi:hypothetical protein
MNIKRKQKTETFTYKPQFVLKNNFCKITNISNQYHIFRKKYQKNKETIFRKTKRAINEGECEQNMRNLSGKCQN